MDLGDDRGSFANRGPHALRRSRAHVTDREDPGPTRLELKWCSPDVDGGSELLAGRDEPLFIDIDATAEPISVGIGPNKKKNLAQSMFDAGAVLSVPECRTDRPAGLSMQSGEFTPDMVFDVRQGRDPLHQISGHRFGKISSGD